MKPTTDSNMDAYSIPQNCSPNLSNHLFCTNSIPFKEDRKWIEQIINHIKRNMDNCYFTVRELSYTMAVSERHLRRRFKQLTDMTPAHYLKRTRLERAHHYLIAKEFKTITQVAHAVGYRDVPTFKSSYEAMFGESVNMYMNE